MKKSTTVQRRLEKVTEHPASRAYVEARLRGPLAIFDRFSTEQQVQILRLSRACDMEGTTERETIENTIATLAEAALYTLGLDPLAEDALYRFKRVVMGEYSSFCADLFNAVNDEWRNAQEWTKGQRAAERPESLKGRAA